MSERPYRAMAVCLKKCRDTFDKKQIRITAYENGN